MEKIKINRNSWTYKILSMIYTNEDQMPKSRCGYTWTFLFSLITFPIWIITKNAENINSLPIRVFVGMLLWFVIGVIIMASLMLITSMGVYLFTDMSMFPDPEIVKEVTYIAYSGFIMIGLGIGRYLYTKFNIRTRYLNLKWNLFIKHKDEDDKDDSSLWSKVCKPIEYVDE